MHAAILAGGLGTRLRDTVPGRQKTVAEVAGRPFLAHLLDQLVEAGAERIVACTGHLHHQVETLFGDEHRGVPVLYSREHSRLGTGGALRQALPLVGPGPLLVMNGDSWCPVDLRLPWSRHASNECCATLVAVRVDDASRYGRLQVDDRERVEAFCEKDGRAEPGWINAGVYVLEREVVASIALDPPISLERDVLPRFIARGLAACCTDAPFIDIGTPDSFALAQHVLAETVEPVA